MKNLIPHFIEQKLKSGEIQGEFKGAALFMDISGFTKITEKLMKSGSNKKEQNTEGAEILADIINSVLDPAINIIYENGGFIANFAGDAFTAIFEKQGCSNALLSAIKINLIFEKFNNLETAFGNFNLSVKIGLSFGSIKYGITGDSRKAFCFKGNSITNCAAAESECLKNEITADLYFRKQIKNANYKFEKTENGFFKLTGFKKLNVENKKIKIRHIDRKTAELFYNTDILDYKYLGEYRDIISVFISFKDYDKFTDLNNFISEVINNLNIYGGYLSLLDFGDKGPVIFIIFGIPQMYEKIYQRAIQFVSVITEKYKNLKIGINSGRVFAGILGNTARCAFTALGNAVNLSARLMSAAAESEILISAEVKKHLINQAQIIFYSVLELKGIEKPQSVYRFIRLNNINQNKQSIKKLVGRDNELNNIINFSKPLFENKFAGTVNIYGEPGMGKSQLALQFIEKINDSVSLLTMESDSILKNSLNPVVYFLNKHFDQTNISDYAEKKKNFEKKFFFIINELSKSKIDYYKNLSDELIRTKSLIAGLIGIYYENSLYYKLDSQARYENTLYAVKELIKAESAIKPVILLIEDFHWIDEDTKNFLHILITNPEKINLLIIATARFNDDGSKPVLFPAGLLRQNHLELKSFDKNNVNEMIRIQLKAEPNNDLFQFILRKSEGNPFYIEQICTYLRENNLIRKKEKKIRLIKGKIEIPSSIQSLIISRIDRLSSELKEITQVASVIGREFDITILANMINILARGISKKNNSNTDYYNANNGIGGINDIVISGKTENIWSELSEFIYLFKHILLREAAYSMQLKARLKSLHFTAASAMEKMFKNDKRFALEIAYHFDKAGIIIQTKKYLYIAGEFSRDNYKMDIALRVYSRLYELSDSDSEKMNINIIQADIYENIGAFDKAIETVKRGLKLIKNKNDLQIELKLKNILGIVYWKKSLLKEAEKEFIEIINFSKKIKVNTEISNALRHLGIIYMDRGDFDSAVDYYSHSLKICRVLNDKINLGWNTFSLGYAYYEIKADYAQAQKYYDRTLKIFKNINFDYGILICLRSFGFIFHYNLIDYNKALFYYHGSLEISEKLGRKRDICYVLNKISDVNILQGKLFSALENYNKSLEIAEELGDAVQISSSLNQIANINGMLCKFDIAHTALDKAYSICNHTKNESQFYWLAYAKALVYIYQSDYKNAAKYLSESVRIGEKTGIINMIGARYGYLAYCYVKLKLYCKAVDFIYKSFITISKLGGNDVLYGRTHLASAMLANAVPEFSKDERSKKIFELTGLDFNPDTYFNNAISIAEKSDFNETLIPALYEYAAYLSRIGQKIKSEKILNRSFEAAKRLGWTYELKKIEKSVKNQKAKFNNNKFSIL